MSILVTKAEADMLLLVGIAAVAVAMLSFAVGICGFIPDAVGAIISSASTTTQPQSNSVFMPISRMVADIPSGFISFCIRFPDQCERPPNAATRIALTDAVWKLLGAVNHHVNDSIWPESDEKHYGRAEYWTIPTDGYGDCEDYALTKKRDLMTAGLPESALRLAIAYTPSEARHAVLTVATDHGDYVLDNLRNDIVTWNKTGYAWVERQNPVQPLGWLTINPNASGHDPNQIGRASCRERV